MTLVAERLLGAVGFKKLIVGGLLFVMFPLILFPYLPDIKIWFILRLVVGIGDSALHYAAQLWVLLVTAPEKRGRYISLYGMSYGLGFSIGPLGIKLLGFGEAVPFWVLFICMAAVLLLVLMRLPDTKSEKAEHGQLPERRFRRSWAWAWYALIPALLYGYMEAGMNSNFPVYGLRIGLDANEISSLLPFVGIGGLFLQLPLGILSDRFGRKSVNVCWYCRRGDVHAGTCGRNSLLVHAGTPDRSRWVGRIVFLTWTCLCSRYFTKGTSSCSKRCGLIPFYDRQYSGAEFGWSDDQLDLTRKHVYPAWLFYLLLVPQVSCSNINQVLILC